MVAPKQRTTETMSVSESRRQYSEVLNRVYRDEEQIIIEKNGIPVAAIVPMAVVRDAEVINRRRADLRAAFEATRAEFRDIPSEEIEREIEKAIAEVEEELRERRAISDAAGQQ